MNHKQKTRQLWSMEQDEQLKQLFDLYGVKKNPWKKISSAMKSKGFHRSCKSCRERYNYQLNKNKSELTEGEVHQLFSLIDQHGNKWSEIAKRMGRNDLEIKNSFYAHVLKIFRRLVKSAFQTRTSTLLTHQIRPIFISSILCNNNQQIQIDHNIIKVFKQLILDNQNIKLGAELDTCTIEQVKFVMNYFEKENLKYLENSKQKREMSKTIKQNCICSKTETDQLLSRIKARNPIFKISAQKIDTLYDTNDEPLLEMTTKDFHNFELIPQFSFQETQNYGLFHSLSNGYQFDSFFSNQNRWI